MEFFETVEKRHSVREFTDTPVDGKTLKKILEAVNLAPSAGNIQAYRITIVRDEEKKHELAIAALDQEFVGRAPVVLVFSADHKQAELRYSDRNYELYAIQDATIAAAYCQLAASALGLGTVWVGGFDTLEVSRLIGAQEEEVPVAIIPVGYPNEKPERTSRKELKELIREI